MPMPHKVMLDRIKRRLKGKDGAEKARELREILKELPVYESGPYAEMRVWVQSQLQDTRARQKVVHRSTVTIPREGAARVSLVGVPSAGKSSLLEAISHVQLKIGDYAFTTLQPTPALVRIHGVLIQFVEIPGLVAGVSDTAAGHTVMGIVRSSDIVVYCHDVTALVEGLEVVRSELEAADIDRPGILAATKMDEAGAGDLERLRIAANGLPVIGVSVLDDDSLEAFKEMVWGATGLIAVYLRHNGAVDPDPVALSQGATVADVAESIHKELRSAARLARVWGPSARFDGQQVGYTHTVEHGDTVEILVR